MIKIGIASSIVGAKVKKQLIRILENEGYQTIDCGEIPAAFDRNPVGPVASLCEALKTGQIDKAISIYGAGLGNHIYEQCLNGTSRIYLD